MPSIMARWATLGSTAIRQNLYRGQINAQKRKSEELKGENIDRR